MYKLCSQSILIPRKQIDMSEHAKVQKQISAKHSKLTKGLLQRDVCLTRRIFLKFFNADRFATHLVCFCKAVCQTRYRNFLIKCLT